MNRNKQVAVILVVALLLTPGCLFRKKKADGAETAKVKTYDVRGTVQKIDEKSLVIQPSGKGPSTFVLTPLSVKGSDFKPGASVHVFYQIRDDKNMVTMVVEKVQKK
ncbi:MAG: hypothetical protein ACR2L2_01255 [Acidobacteriota bacterium]